MADVGMRGKHDEVADCALIARPRFALIMHGEARLEYDEGIRLARALDCHPLDLAAQGPRA